MTCILHVAVQTPAHSGVGDLLSYQHTEALAPGTLVRVPLGQREVLGVVWDALPGEPLPRWRSCAPWPACSQAWRLDAAWRRLVAFAARYYQRGLGEVALAALPPQLRELGPEQLARRLRRRPAPAQDAPDAPKLPKP
ncbi:MAG: hypothetical protein U1E74_08955 [Paenacidovorax caeni]